MIRVGIVGGTGYTGVELLRILALHPEVEVTVVTSRADTGKPVDEVYPNLQGLYKLSFTAPTIESLLDCDLVFFATPNGIAMTMTEALLDKGIKVIDLSADFRLQDIAIWEKWYGMTHACPDLVSTAVYGLVEMNREAIKNTSLIACAGCYPTAVQLGLLPLIKAGLMDSSAIIADVKSGVSGAGRKAALPTLMSETGESFKAYAVDGHRHLPEIEQGLAIANQGKALSLTFVPQLTPMIRGIHATMYTQTNAKLTDIQRVYEQHYVNDTFVNVLKEQTAPDTRNVRGSNYCQIGLFKPQGKNTLVVLSVIDNLVKGAAGQAVQAMNINYGFEETLGLGTVALYP